MFYYLCFLLWCSALGQQQHAIKYGKRVSLIDAFRFRSQMSALRPITKTIHVDVESTPSALHPLHVSLNDPLSSLSTLLEQGSGSSHFMFCNLYPSNLRAQLRIGSDLTEHVSFTNCSSHPLSSLQPQKLSIIVDGAEVYTTHVTPNAKSNVYLAFAKADRQWSLEGPDVGEVGNTDTRWFMFHFAMNTPKQDIYLHKDYEKLKLGELNAGTGKQVDLNLDGSSILNQGHATLRISNHHNKKQVAPDFKALTNNDNQYLKHTAHVVALVGDSGNSAEFPIQVWSHSIISNAAASSYSLLLLSLLLVVLFSL